MSQKLSMDYQKSLFYLALIPVLLCLYFQPVHCDKNPLNEQNNYYNSFISARMKHLTAIQNLKESSNSVKRHKLILNTLKTVFKVLDEIRKVPAIRNIVLANLSETDPHLQDVFQYFESAAFLCDFLVFFPDVTVKLLESNLLWRIMLIDSIQDAMSSTVKFVDNNTRKQFEKANIILSEGINPEDEQTTLPEKSKETKKNRRKPRLTTNEL